MAGWSARVPSLSYRDKYSSANFSASSNVLNLRRPLLDPPIILSSYLAFRFGWFVIVVSFCP